MTRFRKTVELDCGTSIETDDRKSARALVSVQDFHSSCRKKCMALSKLNSLDLPKILPTHS